MTGIEFIVSGGRTFSKHVDGKPIEQTIREQQTIISVIRPIFQIEGIRPFLIHGGAEGTDMTAGSVSLSHGMEPRVFHARWDMYGKRAGTLRNETMLEETNPIFLIAFPGGRGTSHMVRIARKSGLKVFEKDVDNNDPGDILEYIKSKI